jgi:hypothetical protein
MPLPSCFRAFHVICCPLENIPLAGTALLIMVHSWQLTVKYLIPLNYRRAVEANTVVIVIYIVIRDF